MSKNKITLQLTTEESYHLVSALEEHIETWNCDPPDMPDPWTEIERMQSTLIKIKQSIQKEK